MVTATCGTANSTTSSPRWRRRPAPQTPWSSSAPPSHDSDDASRTNAKHREAQEPSLKPNGVHVISPNGGITCCGARPRLESSGVKDFVEQEWRLEVTDSRMFWSGRPDSNRQHPDWEIDCRLQIENYVYGVNRRRQKTPSFNDLLHGFRYRSKNGAKEILPNRPLYEGVHR